MFCRPAENAPAVIPAKSYRSSQELPFRECRRQLALASAGPRRPGGLKRHVGARRLDVVAFVEFVKAMGERPEQMLTTYLRRVDDCSGAGKA